jgi:NTP pyrophosphatase (non-canonical NTP hydrolase)
MYPATIEKIFASTEVDRKSLVEFGLKAAEELGELSEAILSFSNVSACGYKQLSRDDVVEEAIDVVIVCLAAMAKVYPELTIAELNRRTEAKIAKWYEAVELDTSTSAGKNQF